MLIEFYFIVLFNEKNFFLKRIIKENFQIKISIIKKLFYSDFLDWNRIKNIKPTLLFLDYFGYYFFCFYFIIS